MFFSEKCHHNKKTKNFHKTGKTPVFFITAKKERNTNNEITKNSTKTEVF